MKTIWKFPIAVVDTQEIEMPFNALILCVQVQHGQPCLWAEVGNLQTARSKRPKWKSAQIAVYGTGHPMLGERFRPLHRHVSDERRGRWCFMRLRGFMTEGIQQNVSEESAPRQPKELTRAI